MRVHVEEAGQQSFAVPVDVLGIIRDANRICRPDTCDMVAIEDDGLVFARGSAWANRRAGRALRQQHVADALPTP